MLNFKAWFKYGCWINFALHMGLEWKRIALLPYLMINDFSLRILAQHMFRLWRPSRCSCATELSRSRSNFKSRTKSKNIRFGSRKSKHIEFWSRKSKHIWTGSNKVKHFFCWAENVETYQRFGREGWNIPKFGRESQNINRAPRPSWWTNWKRVKSFSPMPTVKCEVKKFWWLVT